METTNWRDRAPAFLRDTLTGPDGEPCFTTTDRRWLWRLENAVAMHARPGTHLGELSRDLRQYLNETCEHHWRESPACPVYEIGEHRQCVWCSWVEWRTAAGGWSTEAQ
jgi:hypothetical protein